MGDYEKTLTIQTNEQKIQGYDIKLLAKKILRHRFACDREG